MLKALLSLLLFKERLPVFLSWQRHIMLALHPVQLVSRQVLLEPRPSQLVLHPISLLVLVS